MILRRQRFASTAGIRVPFDSLLIQKEKWFYAKAIDGTWYSAPQPA
jgi:hypothetical protein